jgi:transcriptional regulator with XRE-family HTH domain
MNSGNSPITKILSEEEVQATIREMREGDSQQLVESMISSGIDLEKTVRFMPVAERCKQTRDKSGLNLATVARELKVKQSDLQCIENAQNAKADPDILHRYLHYLGLGQWFGKWAAANSQLADQLKPKTAAASAPAKAAGKRPGAPRKPGSKPRGRGRPKTRKTPPKQEG